MRSRLNATWTALLLGTLASLAITTAQPRHATAAALASDVTRAAAPSTDAEEMEVVEETDPREIVVQHDLSGPRLGATFSPNGDAVSQFGWHVEHQASPGSRGPWFIVETVFLLGGLERDAFVPNGSLLFGMRVPGGFEFGVGPSVTIGGGRGFQSAIVVAVGQSFRAGGIRIPVNLALAADKDGEHRVTLVTGWAIRKPVMRRVTRRDGSI